MNYFDDLVQKKNIGEVVLLLLFLIYLFTVPTLSYKVAEFISSIAGMVIIGLVVIYLFFKCNPILGIVGLIVAYTLIKSSRMMYSQNDKYALGNLAQFAPRERTVYSPFTPTQQFPYTLEEELVEKMAPLCSSTYNLNPASFTPNAENTYDSAPV